MTAIAMDSRVCPGNAGGPESPCVARLRQCHHAALELLARVPEDSQSVPVLSIGVARDRGGDHREFGEGRLPRFRTIQARPKDLWALSQQPQRVVGLRTGSSVRS
jgi:hypothetical protein